MKKQVLLCFVFVAVLIIGLSCSSISPGNKSTSLSRRFVTTKYRLASFLHTSSSAGLWKPLSALMPSVNIPRPPPNQSTLNLIRLVIWTHYVQTMGWIFTAAAAENAAFAATHPVRSTYSTVSTGVPAYTSTGSTSSGGTWACIRSHESGGNYSENTGNGYYGAYQFLQSTWNSVAPPGYAGMPPNDAPPSVQDQAAQTLQARSGWGQWSTAAGCGA